LSGLQTLIFATLPAITYTKCYALALMFLKFKYLFI
jgi:hypothetical protein